MGIQEGPFRGSEAVGTRVLTRHELSRRYTRVLRDVYVPNGTALDARTMAVAATVCVGDGTVIAGISASAMHGAKWVDATETPSVLSRIRSCQQPGLTIHHDAYRSSEVEVLEGSCVTTAARTMFDIGRWVAAPRSIASMDALVAATGVSAADVRALAEVNKGVRGVRRLLSALDLVDGGAESPQETRTRLLLIGAGLPTPTTQIEVRDANGLFVARVDIGWVEWQVGVEYDGVQHWLDERQRTRDIDRLEQLDQCSWGIVRVNSEQLRQRPHDVVARVRAKLRAAGAPV